MGKLYRPTPKIFLNMAGERMHTFHPSALDPPLAISYRNHKNSLIYRYFSHLGTLIFILFLLKGRVKREGAWHNACPHVACLSNICLSTCGMSNLCGLHTHGRTVASDVATGGGGGGDWGVTTLLIEPKMTSYFF